MFVLAKSTETVTFKHICSKRENRYLNNRHMPYFYLISIVLFLSMAGCTPVISKQIMKCSESCLWGDVLHDMVGRASGWLCSAGNLRGLV